MTCRGRVGMAVAVALVVGALPAWGSGFSIYEQGAEASGRAGAWVASADDPAANWYNPAGLARMKGFGLQLGTNWITIGVDTTFKTAVGEASTIQNNEFPSHLYYGHRVHDRVAIGIGVNNPFGLVSEWGDPRVTPSSRRTELVTYVVNPNLAFKLDDAWSLAIGVDYLYADVKEFSKDLVPFIASQNLTGTGSTWGHNVAILFDKDDWAFGLSYRSKLSADIDGDVKIDSKVPLPPGVPGQLSASATLDLPAQVVVGGKYRTGEDGDIEINVTWTQWSRFKRLKVTGSVPVDLGAGGGGDEGPQAPIVNLPITLVDLDESWSDTFSFRIGGAWRFEGGHEIRFGAVYDQSPVPAKTLRPSIPDSDRVAASLGYGYGAKHWSLDLYYMPMFWTPADARPDAVTVNQGVIAGRYESFVHLLGATVGIRF